MGPALGLVSSERRLLCGREGKLGLSLFHCLAPQPHSLPRGRGLVNSPAGFQPANEFSGSKAGPGVSPHLKTLDTLLPSSRRVPQRPGFLPLPPLLSHWAPGVWVPGRPHPTQMSLLSLSSCSLALRAAARGQGQDSVPRSFLRPLGSSRLPWLLGGHSRQRG